MHKIRLNKSMKTGILISSQWRIFRVCRRSLSVSLHSPWRYWRTSRSLRPLVMAFYIAYPTIGKMNWQCFLSILLN